MVSQRFQTEPSERFWNSDLHCDLPDVNRSDVNYGYWVHFSAINPLINMVVLLCCKDLKSMLGPRVFSYLGCSLTDDYADAGCLPNACIYYSRKGRKLREGFSRQFVSPTLRSIRDYFLLLSILVPIICPWVLRILYNTGISCCEKAGRWQLAATTLAAIIEETAPPQKCACIACTVPFVWHSATQHPTMPWCLQERLADEISYNAAISACEKGGEWEWVSRAAQGFS